MRLTFTTDGSRNVPPVCCAHAQLNPVTRAIYTGFYYRPPDVQMNLEGDANGLPVTVGTFNYRNGTRIFTNKASCSASFQAHQTSLA